MSLFTNVFTKSTLVSTLSGDSALKKELPSVRPGGNNFGGPYWATYIYGWIWTKSMWSRYGRYMVFWWMVSYVHHINSMEESIKLAMWVVLENQLTEDDSCTTISTYEWPNSYVHDGFRIICSDERDMNEEFRDITDNLKLNGYFRNALSSEKRRRNCQHNRYM